MDDEGQFADLARQCIESTADCICVLSPDLRVLLWNPAMAALTGVPEREALGSAVTDIIPDLQRVPPGDQLPRVLSGETVCLVPWPYEIRRTGRAGFGRLELTPMGSPVGRILVTFRDITPMAESRRSLEAGRVLLDAILQSAPVAIVAFDRHLLVTFWNRQAENMFGWTEHEIIGEPALWIPGESRDEHRMLAQIAAQSPVPLIAEVARRRKDGSGVDLSVSIQAVRNSAGEVTGYTAIYQDITERKAIERSLRLSESRLQRAHQIARMGTFEAKFSEWPPAGPATYLWADGLYEILGQDPETSEPSLQGLLKATHPDDRQKLVEFVERPLAEHAARGVFDHRVLLPGGETRVIRHHVEVQRNPEGGVSLAGAVQDITEYRRLEEQLFQAQKLEGIGQLAGGVAHDFNNLLTIINGYADLLSRDASVTSACRENASAILSAGRRAADLTRQLLAFSRRQILQPRPVNLNEAFSDLRRMLDRLLAANIEVIENLDPEIDAVHADAGQLQQVMLNIIVNARDAMPSGGTLAVETSNVVIDESYCDAHPDANPGPYVCLSITDSGTGMDARTQARIFEPFFTTKEMGRGTGLGLATVYGIVKQSRGFIWVYSEPGRGTTFKVYLPSLHGPARKPAAAPEDAAHQPGDGITVLLVEDQEAVRRFAGRVLRGRGHRVLEASSGDEALELAALEAGPIHLMLADVVMPGMPARALSEAILARRPDIRILYTSGYSESAIFHQGILDPGIKLLPKPFSSRDLLARIDEMLKAG